MKKLILTSLITLSLSQLTSYGATGGMFGSFSPMEGFQDIYDSQPYEGPDDNETVLIKQKKEKFVSDEASYDSVEDALFSEDDNNTVQSVMYNSIMTADPRTGAMGQAKFKKNNVYEENKLPLFKRARIHIMNACRKQQYESYKKDLAKEEQSLKEFEQELDKEQVKNNIFFTSKKKKDTNDQKANEVVDVKFEEPSEQVVQQQQPIKLKGKLKETRGENLVVLDAKDVYYLEDTNEIVAEHDAVVKFPRQKVTMRAEKFVYQKSANIVHAIGNVKITYLGRDIFCDSIQVSLDEEDISFSNLNASLDVANFVAESGESHNNILYLYNGYLEGKGNQRIGMASRKIKHVNPETLVPLPESEKFYLQNALGKNDFRINFDVDKIKVNSKDEHDVVTLRDLKVKYGDRKLFKLPSLTFYTDKKRSSFEANYPELGSIARLGMFIGPGVVLEVPKAGVVKLIPFLNYGNSKLGVGGAVRYHSQTNVTELSYASSSNIFVLKGKQVLDDKLSLNYGMNYFFEQWWLGARMPKYALDIQYRDKYLIPSTLKKGLDLRYEHRGTFGYYHNSMYNMNNETFKSGNIGTLRLRYMAQVEQDLYKFVGNQPYKNFRLSALMQGSAALYGTGDTQMIGRIGLRAHSQWKYWVQDVSYFLSAWDDHTPMKRFDAYRYGTSSVYVREALRLCKFATIAWVGLATLSNDAPNNKLFQENAFLLVLGPEDLKLTLGYDVIRKSTYFTIGFSLNTTGSKVRYNVLEIKNPDKLANKDDQKLEELQPEFWLIPKENVKKVNYQYAKIININENDNRERID